MIDLIANSITWHPAFPKIHGVTHKKLKPEEATMMKFRTTNLARVLLTLVTLLFSACLPAAGDDDALAKAIAASSRTPANTERDQYRHPQQTLDFFGIKPGMTVVEVLPGRGWYTEVLAPYLASDGKLIAASYGENNERDYLSGIHAGYMEILNANPDAYGKITVVDFKTPTGYVDDIADASVDMVLDFRNTHNLIRWYGGADEAYRHYYRILKPGGVLGVIEHRAEPGGDAMQTANTGYVPEQYSIDVATSAGFKLEVKSDINANPKDTKDHPNGVWTLPPRQRWGDDDPEKYLAIGESDRMTLKFVKPAK